jgi:hypothetical protein
MLAIPFGPGQGKSPQEPYYCWRLQYNQRIKGKVRWLCGEGSIQERLDDLISDLDLFMFLRTRECTLGIIEELAQGT